MREEEIDTPALLIDLDACEFNLDRMMQLLAPTSVKLRPHSKTHKSPVIAHQQIARGPVGVCVQKVAEAEVFAAGGVPDVLVSNEIVGASKLARLCAIPASTTIAVCADDSAHCEWLEAAAAAVGRRFTRAFGRGGCSVVAWRATASAPPFVRRHPNRKRMNRWTTTTWRRWRH
jgi:D-serine deaminase-like pyridoxal phosphate-dependent protein